MRLDDQLVDDFPGGAEDPPMTCRWAVPSAFKATRIGSSPMFSATSSASAPLRVSYT